MCVTTAGINVKTNLRSQIFLLITANRMIEAGVYPNFTEV